MCFTFYLTDVATSVVDHDPQLPRPGQVWSPDPRQSHSVHNHSRFWHCCENLEQQLTSRDVSTQPVWDVMLAYLHNIIQETWISRGFKSLYCMYVVCMYYALLHEYELPWHTVCWDFLPESTQLSQDPPAQSCIKHFCADAMLGIKCSVEHWVDCFDFTHAR